MKDGSEDMYVVVGLGNPGPNYAQTRHNVGHMVVAQLADQLGVRLSAHRATRTIHATARTGFGAQSKRLVLATCESYMNTSGGPVSQLLRYYHVAPENLIVVHDDLDLQFAELKLKRGGGEGGHNGLKSISSSLGTKDYIRMRLGIGRPPARMNPADYVLQKFAKAEATELEISIREAADAVIDVIENGLEPATMRLHTAQRAAHGNGRK